MATSKTPTRPTAKTATKAAVKAPAKPAVKKPTAKAVSATKTPAAKPPVVKTAAAKPPTKTPVKAAPARPASKAPAVKPAAPVSEGVSGMVLRHILCKDLIPAGDNLRGTLTDISDLAASIDEVGILEPLTVVDANPLGDTIIGYGAGERWMIVAGHRRHAAVKWLIENNRWDPAKPLPCVTTKQDGEITTDAERVVQMLVENLQRRDLNPVEEARGYQRLIDAGWRQKRIAEAVGYDENRVSARKQLLKLPAVWLEQLIAGTLPLGTAQALAQLPQDMIDHLATKGSIPTPGWQLDQACRDWTRTKAENAVLKFCDTRGLKYSNKNRWEIQRTHNASTTLPVKNLDQAIAPPGTVLVSVYMPTTGGLDAKAEIELWIEIPTASDDDLAVDSADPVRLWEKECERLDREHKAAVKAWNERRAAFTHRYAGTLTGKDVGSAAIGFLRREITEYSHEGDKRIARDLGWQTPEGVDEATVDASLEAWWSDARNLYAGVAVYMLNDDTMCPALLQDPHQQAVTAELGAAPVRPDNPPHPDRAGVPVAVDEEAEDDDADEPAEQQS